MNGIQKRLLQTTQHQKELTKQNSRVDMQREKSLCSEFGMQQSSPGLSYSFKTLLIFPQLKWTPMISFDGGDYKNNS